MVLDDLSYGNFFSAPNMRKILSQFWPLSIIALGAVVATRIKGPDLSIGMLMGLSSAIFAVTAKNGNVFMGIILAFVVCCFYGLLNGTVISLLNIPPAILTVVTATQLYFITLWITGSRSMMMEDIVPQAQILRIILFVVSAAIALVALIITNRFPKQKREKKNGFSLKLMVIFGYALVAIIAGIAGFAMISQLGAASTSMGNGWDIYIIFIFAAVQSSKLLKNNLIALGYGLAAALIFTVFRNTIMVYNIFYMWVRAIEATMALMLLCAACAAQGGWRSALGSNLSECEEKSPD